MIVVSMLRWPAEQELRDSLAADGSPRLLLLEEGPPPVLVDPLEDWIRLPADDAELWARVESLRRRWEAPNKPELNPEGVLTWAGQWVALSPLDARLVGALLERFSAMVSHEMLIQATAASEDVRRNSLDVQLHRLFLTVRIIKPRGAPPNSDAAGGRLCRVADNVRKPCFLSVPASWSRGQTRMRRKLLFGAILTGVLVLAGAAPALAQEEAVAALGQQINLLWIVIGAVLVVFMQAGFALVETGFTRAKHAAHVVSTNFAIFGLGFVAFFLVGYGLMFGGYSYVLPGFDFGYDHAVGSALFSVGDWVFLWKGGFALTDLSGPFGAAVMGFFFYMVAFMDTTATIPTGALAERWQWKNFVLWGFFCGALYYPIFGAWTWGGGWLSQLGNNLGLGYGYTDFAGSGVVHAMGGVAAFVGARVLGPRIGKFNKDGSSNTLAHHIPMAMLGTFILLFGWFGFNAASTLAATDVQFAVVATNTAIAGAFGAVVGMLWAMRRLGKPDPGMMANGMLAGLVAITAPCAFVSPQASAIIGSIAAILVIESILFVEKKLKIDDPVGAISVHGVCGTFGVLAVGLFANGTYGAGWNLTTSGAVVEAGVGITGVFKNFSLGLGQLASQAIGAATIWIVMGAIVYVWFKLSDKITPLRSKVEDELLGLDLPEMGVLAYPEFTHRELVLETVTTRESSPYETKV